MKVKSKKKTYQKYTYLKENGFSIERIGEMFEYKSKDTFVRSRQYRKIMSIVEEIVREVNEKKAV